MMLTQNISKAFLQYYQRLFQYINSPRNDINGDFDYGRTCIFIGSKVPTAESFKNARLSVHFFIRAVCSVSWPRVITLPARPFYVIMRSWSDTRQLTTSTRVIMSTLRNECCGVIDTRKGTRSVPTYFYFYL